MTTEQPAALPATLTLSKSNIRDFIEARGVNVPVIVAGQSLIDFIISTAQDAAFNLIRVPTKLKSDCQRAGQTAAKTALLEWVNQQFPIPEERGQGFQLNGIPEKLPRYTVDNGMIVACEAAEKAIRPWVWGNAHHTNPRRQAAGVVAAAAIKQQQNEQPVVAPAETEVDHQTLKSRESIKLADSEFESPVPFSSAGQFATPVTAEELKEVQSIVSLEEWLTEHGLRTMELEGCEQPWICLVASLTDDSIASKMGMKVALSQGLVVQGMTELQACANYAGKNKLPWPDSLAHTLEQQALS
jgi:hypothetical protein